MDSRKRKSRSHGGPDRKRHRLAAAAVAKFDILYRQNLDPQLSVNADDNFQSGSPEDYAHLFTLNVESDSDVKISIEEAIASCSCRLVLLANVPGQQRICGKCKTIIEIYPAPSSRGRSTSSRVRSHTSRFVKNSPQSALLD